jgi:hypothetical protein
MGHNSPPDEKTIEIAFAQYAARLAQQLGKTLIMYAPSQVLEKEVGYDNRLIGAGAKELYIQFKKSNAPNYGYSLNLNNKQQMKTLKDKYLSGSAFYVAGSFENDGDFLTTQHRASTGEFLNKYLAVNAHILENTSTLIRFSEQNLIQRANNSSQPNHGYKRIENKISRSDWKTGCELLCDFLGCECDKHGTVISASRRPSVGCQIRFTSDGRPVRLPINFQGNVDRFVSEFQVNDNFRFVPGQEVSRVLRVIDSI